MVPVVDKVLMAKFAFQVSANGARYLGAPVITDFPVTYESLAPYVQRVLDLAAPLEGSGTKPTLVQILGGVVRVT